MKLFKGLVKDVRSELGSKKAIRDVEKFIIIFLATFVLLYFVLTPLIAPAWHAIGVFSANGANWLLNMFGFDTTVSENVLRTSVDGTQYDFVVSQLCSGDVEIALLASLLIASFDILLSWRIAGSFIGAFGIILINPVRIALTLGLTKTLGLNAGDVAHSFIFRIFLFVFLVTYYFVWYRMCKGRGPFKLEHLKLWK